MGELGAVRDQQAIEHDRARRGDVDDAVHILHRCQRFQIAQIDGRTRDTAVDHHLTRNRDRMGVGATVTGHERDAFCRVDAALDVHTAGGRTVKLTAQDSADAGARQAAVLDAAQQAIHIRRRRCRKGQATGVDLAFGTHGKAVAVDEQQIATDVAVGQAAFQPAVHAHLRIAHDVDPPVGALGHQHLDLIALPHRKVRVRAEGIAIAQALRGDRGLSALGADHRAGLARAFERRDHRLPQHHGAGGTQGHSRSQGHGAHPHQQAPARHPGLAARLTLCKGRCSGA